jgi:hypothetical protein
MEYNWKVELTEEEVKDLVRIWHYFAIHDKSTFEHHAYNVMNRLLKKMRSDLPDSRDVVVTLGIGTDIPAPTKTIPYRRDIPL